MLRDVLRVSSPRRRDASTGYSPRATLHRSCRPRGTAGVEKESEGDETLQGCARIPSPVSFPAAVFAPTKRVHEGGYTCRRNKGVAGNARDKKLNVRVGGKKKEREREKGGGRDKVGERNLANENGAIFNPSPRI